MNKKNISSLLILTAFLFLAVLSFSLSQKVFAAPIRTYGAVYIHTSFRSGGSWWNQAGVPVAVNSRGGGSYSGACNTGGTPVGRDCGSQSVIVNSNCGSSTGFHNSDGSGWTYYEAPSYAFAACHCSFDIILASLGNKDGSWSTNNGTQLITWHDWYWSTETGAFGNDQTWVGYFDWCYNECHLGDVQYRCSGNMRQQRTCGYHDQDTCYDWSPWGNIQDCGGDYWTNNYRCSGQWLQRQYVSRGCSGTTCFANTSWQNIQNCGTSGWLNEYQCTADGSTLQQKWCDRACIANSCSQNCYWKDKETFPPMELCPCRDKVYAGKSISVSDIIELRASINKNEGIAKRSVTSWTDSNLKTGMPIRYIHTKQMCDALVRLNRDLSLGLNLKCPLDNVAAQKIVSGTHLKHICDDLNDIVNKYNSSKRCKTP